jgi:hypothetical protein
MKNILSTILILLSAVLVRAEDDKFSYLYIQGDKQTPFYVKLEDAMQPRFGKNYCIIPKMAPWSGQYRDPVPAETSIPHKNSLY